jgi:hypothetical protein
VVLPERGCGDCHVDAHEGRYSSRCTECHDAERFAPSTVGVAAHAGFDFPLEGAHRAVPCPACHKTQSRRPALSVTLIGAARPRPAADYSVADQRCSACHKTPHGTQFDARADGGACGGCHGVDGFAPADRFDHDRDARFPLKGAHAPVACSACHRASRPGAPVSYRPLSFECSSCHADLGSRR